MATVTYSVPNISCHHCVNTIQNEVGELDGVHEVRADVNTKMVTIHYEAPATDEQIRDTLVEINYPPAQ